METRRGFLKYLLGGAIAVGPAAGAIASLHMGENEDVPPIGKSESRVVLYSLDLGAPANVINAKHLFLRFEFGPMNWHYDVHGFATDRETREKKAVGFPDKDDICVQTVTFEDDAIYSTAFDENSGFGGKIRPVAVLKSSEKVSEIFTLYKRALDAGAEINKLKLPYHALTLDGKTPNSNAVAGTTIDACGLKMPESMVGTAPGKEYNILKAHHVELPPSAVYPETEAGLLQLGIDAGYSLRHMNTASDENPQTSERQYFVESPTAQTLKRIGWLCERSYPVEPRLISYLAACDKYENMRGPHYSSEDYRNLKNNIFRGRGEIKMNYGIELPLPQRLVNEMTSNFYDPQPGP